MLPRGSKLAPKPLKRKSSSLVRKPIKKPKKKAKSKAWKFVKTALAECDSAVSKEVIARDGHCQYPGCQKTTDLTCSHYIGRGNWNTRFLLSNLLTICTYHHFFNRNIGYEFQKARKEVEGWDGKYTEHMRQLLGEEGFNELIEISQRKPNRKEAIMETQKKYNLRQPKTAEVPPTDETPGSAVI